MKYSLNSVSMCLKVVDTRRSRQVPINAQTGEVGPSTQVTGTTNRDLRTRPKYNGPREQSVTPDEIQQLIKANIDKTLSVVYADGSASAPFLGRPVPEFSSQGGGK